MKNRCYKIPYIDNSFDDSDNEIFENLSELGERDKWEELTHGKPFAYDKSILYLIQKNGWNYPQKQESKVIPIQT